VKTPARVLGLAFLSVFSLGCVSLSLRGEKVRLTKSAADVAECRVLGDVEANPPFGTPNSVRNVASRPPGLQVSRIVARRSRSASIAADTILRAFASKNCPFLSPVSLMSVTTSFSWSLLSAGMGDLLGREPIPRAA
jgi:hypothetical protein